MADRAPTKIYARTPAPISPANSSSRILGRGVMTYGGTLCEVGASASGGPCPYQNLRKNSRPDKSGELLVAHPQYLLADILRVLAE